MTPVEQLAIPELPDNVQLQSRLKVDHSGYDITNRRGLAALTAAEEQHFWHLSRNLFIGDRLESLGILPPSRILELGCGGGCVSAHLVRAGYCVTGVDGHLERILEAARRSPQGRFVVHDLQRGNPQLEDANFDAVALFDVIEHVDNPGRMIEQAMELTRAGGWVVGTVPALMSLWSRVDVEGGHRRRYEPHTLRALMDSIPGIEQSEMFPFNRLLVPLMWLQRQVLLAGEDAPTAERNLKVPPGPVNWALFRLLRFEHRACGWARNVPGASLWFALRRSSGPKATS